MTETIERKICDVCGNVVEGFAGSLRLKYSERDWAGNGFPCEAKYDDICIDCCRELGAVIDGVIKEMRND